MYTLSEGSLEIIMSEGHVEKPVMQILGSKNIQGSHPIKRYRLLLSDGKHLHDFALLSTRLNDKITSGELCDFTVFRIDHFFTSPLKDTGKAEKLVMTILKVTVIESGQVVGSKIGSPQLWTESSTPAATPTPSLQPAPKEIPVPSVAKKIKLSCSNSQASASSMDTNIISTQTTHPIASLRPHLEKWVIKARVMSKTPIRPYSNARGEGKLFSMDLCDESGKIRAKAFKAECDKFYDIIQTNKVYFISHAQLQAANKQFCTFNDYEIVLKNHTVVRECMEDSSDVSTIKYEFVPIGHISERNPDTILDVIGVCKSATDVQDRTARSTGKLLKKRVVTLMDQSASAITLTLWGSEAESFDANSNPVVCIKGARLAEFNGSKFLCRSYSTTMQLNPDLPEAHELRGWFDNGGADMDAVNVSARAGGYTGGSNEWLTFSEAEVRQLGSSDKDDYYQLLGVVTCVESDNVVYKACPQEQCNKKLVDQENGLYRCEKCNREFPNYKYRLIMMANVADHTGDQRVTAFNEAAEVMLGRSAAEIVQALDIDKHEFISIFDELKYKTFVFEFRTKTETYNDVARVKTIVTKVHPVNYKELNSKLLKSIKELSGVELN